MLHTDDTMTEENFLLQLSTFLLKNIFCNLLIPPFVIHDSNFLLRCLCLLALVGWVENTQPISRFLVIIFLNQTFTFSVKYCHDKKFLISLSSKWIYFTNNKFSMIKKKIMFVNIVMAGIT